ncbi:mechanosensitive ion channel family protein [Massilia arenosa]|uniref:Mechanosensitive ion channel family protein n=1 Tax=Zemynaea arenosa TaxID=2561931 RepID=A0A4Y9RUM4_9BURK|nr:mechanosensitive ion channel family protein [Massilia arenosa]TFW11319.1 mechanosensitive ion channel family protein [Massilia arenosa]
MDYRAFVNSLDISLGNAIFALTVAVVSFVVIHTALALFRRHLCKLEEKHHDRPMAQLLKATLARTSNVMVVAISLLLGLSVLELPVPWDERVRHLWFIALGLQLALYLDRAVAVASQRYFRKHEKSTSADSPLTVAHTLTVWALKTALWVMFILALLSNLGINVTTFVASLGIGGVAVALAVQNILGDLFASLSIAVDKPFEVGDAILVDGNSGTVEHVGLKTTRIRADSGEQIVMGNSQLLKNTVRNYKRMQERRVPVTLKVNPATPQDAAAKVPPTLRKIVEAQEGVRFDRAHLKYLDQNFIEFEMVYYVLNPSYARFMDVQQAVMLGVMKEFDALGVSISAPSQTIAIEQQPTPKEDRRPAPSRPVSVPRQTH